VTGTVVISDDPHRQEIRVSESHLDRRNICPADAWGTLLLALTGSVPSAFARDGMHIPPNRGEVIGDHTGSPPTSPPPQTTGGNTVVRDHRGAGASATPKGGSPK
jgi:hypothetical protein